MFAVAVSLMVFGLLSTYSALPIASESALQDLQASSGWIKPNMRVVAFVPVKNVQEKSADMDTSETIWGLRNNGGGWGGGNWGHYGSGNFGGYGLGYGNGGYGISGWGNGGLSQVGFGNGGFGGYGGYGSYGGYGGNNAWRPFSG